MRTKKQERRARNALQTDGFVAENEKLYNSIYQQTKMQGRSDYTTEEWSAIEYLAFQCPLRGGKAVYWARALYAVIKDTVYDDYQVCTDEGYEMYKRESNDIMKQDSISELKVKVFPNPASNAFYIFSDNINSRDAVVRLQDAAGKIVLEQSLKLSSRGSTVELGKISKGIYIINLQTEYNEPTFRYKLIIVK